jgi:hypothetical protein
MKYFPFFKISPFSLGYILTPRFNQKFVPSIENIEKAVWADQAIFGSTENFFNFPKLSYF